MITADNAIQYRPSPSYRMLSGNPGRLSMNFSTEPFLSPAMWYLEHLLLQQDRSHRHSNPDQQAVTLTAPSERYSVAFISRALTPPSRSR
jgi:hypothetical protein